MTEHEAEELLAGGTLVPLGEAGIAEARELVGLCLSAGIPAAVGSTDGCGPGCSTGGCAPKVQILVREEDAGRVQQLLRDRWVEMVRREGTMEARPAAQGEVDPNAEPPCPACGTAAALVQGACSDCGLQLE